jgi:protein gp37
MSDGTHIQWTDASWNPIRAHIGTASSPPGWHCEKVSQGCAHCYAETINRRLGTGLPYTVASGAVTHLDEKALASPLHWRKPRRVFVCSMTDLFGAWVPDEWLDRIFAVMALSPQHQFQLLTKRPERMREYLGDTISRPADVINAAFFHVLEHMPAFTCGGDAVIDYWEGKFPLPNVWLGVSVEDQAAADARIPELLATPAAVRFLSCEPLIGPVDLRSFLPATLPALDRAVSGPRGGCIDWVIAGGESGPGARPCDLAWIRSIVAQCRAAGVATFVKQLGSHPHTVRMASDGQQRPTCCAARGCTGFDWRRSRVLRDRKGGSPGEWPEDLRVREFPEVRA